MLGTIAAAKVISKPRDYFCNSLDKNTRGRMTATMDAKGTKATNNKAKTTSKPDASKKLIAAKKEVITEKKESSLSAVRNADFEVKEYNEKVLAADNNSLQNESQINQTREKSEKGLRANITKDVNTSAFFFTAREKKKKKMSSMAKYGINAVSGSCDTGEQEEKTSYEKDKKAENTITTNVQLLRTPLKGNGEAVFFMHFVTHKISDLHNEKVLKKNDTSVGSSRPSLLDSKDGLRCGNVSSVRAGSKRSGCEEVSAIKIEEETLKTPQSSRGFSSISPPMFLKKEEHRVPPEKCETPTTAFFLQRLHSPSSASSFSRVPTTVTTETSRSMRQHTRRSCGEAFNESSQLINVLCPSKQLLTRSLASEEEKELTATIVFDLDETLCNNRGSGPAILRPGAVEVLKELRAMYPHPFLKTSRTQSREFEEYNNAEAVRKGTSKGISTSANMAKYGIDAVSGGVAPKYKYAENVILRLELIMWTASVELVARPVIARLDPDGTIFDDIIYRDVRWYHEGGCAKNLRLIGRYMERTIIVENAAASVSMNRNNAILVTDFVNNPADRQLFIVHAILQEWLANLNALLVCRRLSKSAPRRNLTPSQDGGESLEPEGSMNAFSNKGDMKDNSPNNNKTDADDAGGEPLMSSSFSESSSFLFPSLFFSSSTPKKDELREMERNASAMYFLKHHTFLSPGTRYVKPSAWKNALRSLVKSGLKIQIGSNIFITRAKNRPTTATTTRTAIGESAAGCAVTLEHQTARKGKTVGGLLGNTPTQNRMVFRKMTETMPLMGAEYNRALHCLTVVAKLR